MVYGLIMYESTTRNIRVIVKPQYLEEQSKPDENYFVWAYRVIIENNGDETVKLNRRYWEITDSAGRVQEVRGAGVVGEQPRLKPGESFEYTSGAPLATASGFMSGCYYMQNADGEEFDVQIPGFALDQPHSNKALH